MIPLFSLRNAPCIQFIQRPPRAYRFVYLPGPATDMLISAFARSLAFYHTDPPPQCNTMQCATTWQRGRETITSRRRAGGRSTLHRPRSWPVLARGSNRGRRQCQGNKQDRRRRNQVSAEHQDPPIGRARSEDSGQGPKNWHRLLRKHHHRSPREARRDVIASFTVIHKRLQRLSRPPSVRAIV